MHRAKPDRHTQVTGHWLARFAGILLAGLLYAPASQATIELADLPLFFAAGVDPNVFFEVDDSGSMDWEVLTRAYWHFCDYDPDAPNDPWGFFGDTCNNFQRDNGRWNTIYSSGGSPTDFEFIYHNSDAAYNQGCSSGNNGTTMYDCGTVGGLPRPYFWDWRGLSAAFNVLYYNPLATYKPWNGPCMTDKSPCTDASFGSARSDPRQGKNGYSLTTNLDGFVWEVWVDDKGFDPADGRPLRGGDLNVTNTPNNVVDLWDTHVQFTINGGDIIIKTTTYAPTAGGMNPSVTTKTLSGSACFAELASNDSACRTIAEVKQNAANWYQYARKRSFVAKGAISNVISSTPGMRFGLDVINQTIPIIEVPGGSGNFSSNNTNLLATFYDMVWPARGTPLRRGLERAGDYYEHNLGSNITDPIEYSCQQNFTILLTDGYWNGSDPGVGNDDGDPYSDTVADVAHYYYRRDLNKNLANDVPTFPNNTPPDLNDFQHMVTFTAAFGVTGKLVDTDGDFWPNPPLTESDDWGDPFSGGSIPEKIDDLWHAAYNGRGTFLSARTPGALAAGLKAALKNVEERIASVSTVALNTGFISSDTKVYQARFNSADWHGELRAIPVLADGALETDEAKILKAQDVLPAAASRVILTNNGKNGVPVPFRWNSLSPAQQTALNRDSAGNTDTLGALRLDHLRGDAANETPKGPFRARNNGKLGDLVDSGPVFRGPPDARYPDNWGLGAPESCATCKYSDFKAMFSDPTPRTSMVYIGANDGMLHGFDADTMVEKIAYVPTGVFDNLTDLTDPNYNHRFYVDGTPTVIDAFFNSSWHTTLVGGLNKGGQQIYALDVTNPATFAETLPAAANTVLWEFTDANDADLGYTYSKPAIVRMHNGKWAAVFGNGYNSTAFDGKVGSGHAVLFIVDLETGALIRKIDTGVGTDNGLATVAPIDINGDFIVDFLYAGDLDGNLWKFDVTSGTVSDWDVAFKAGGTNLPLFVAKDKNNVRQPITVQPDAGRGPNGLDIMLYFGTGRYLGNADVSDTSDQTFYGIIDNGTVVAGRSVLDAQTVVFQDNTARVTSKNTLSANSRGWFLDLPETGERAISRPILRAGRIIFVTITPESDICKSGGTSFLMELNALNGALLDAPPFDNTSDGLFTVDDYIDTDADGKGDSVQAGKRFEGILPTPGILPDKTREYKFTPNAAGDLDSTVENPGIGNVGRQSWGQLR